MARTDPHKYKTPPLVKKGRGLGFYGQRLLNTHFEVNMPAGFAKPPEPAFQSGRSFLAWQLISEHSHRA